MLWEVLMRSVDNLVINHESTKTDEADLGKSDQQGTDTIFLSIPFHVF